MPKASRRPFNTTSPLLVWCAWLHGQPRCGEGCTAAPNTICEHDVSLCSQEYLSLPLSVQVSISTSPTHIAMMRDQFCFTYIKRLLHSNNRLEDRLSAVDQVLRTYELLEAILLFLRPPHLRVARQVCKQWHAVIAQSRRLEQAWQARCLNVVLLGEPGAGKKSLAAAVRQHSLILFAA